MGRPQLPGGEISTTLPSARTKTGKKTAHTFGADAGSGQPGGKFVPSLVPLPAWYEPERVLGAIAKVVNTIEVSGENNKPAWSAVTGAEGGVVWVSEAGLWSALKNTGGRCDSSFLVAEADEGVKRNLLFTIVRDLGDKGKVLSELIDNSYYQVPVAIITGSGRVIPTFLIPFSEESFGVTALDLETRKGAVLKRMVKTIKPKVEAPAECVL